MPENYSNGMEKPRRFYNKMKIVFIQDHLPGECKEELLIRDTFPPELTFELLEEQPETLATRTECYGKLSTKQ